MRARTKDIRRSVSGKGGHFISLSGHRSARSYRILYLAALLLAFLVQAQPVRAEPTQRQKETQLDRQQRLAMQRGDYEAAIEHGLAFAKLSPGNYLPAYNLACSYSLLFDRDNGVKWLRIAAERGFFLAASSLRDTDLDALRDHPGYAEAMAIIRANNDARLEVLKPRIDNAPLATHVPVGLDPQTPAPLIVALHPYGGQAKPMVRLWEKIADEVGAIVVAPEAHTPYAGGFTWGIMEHAEYTILSAIKRARKMYNIDATKIVLTGFSQGGSMSFYVGLRHPSLIAGVIPMSGHHELKITPVPKSAPDKFPRFYIMNGSLDGAVQNNRRAARDLEKAGALVKLRIYSGVGHALPKDRGRELRTALYFALAR